MKYLNSIVMQWDELTALNPGLSDSRPAALSFLCVSSVIDDLQGKYEMCHLPELSAHGDLWSVSGF